MKLCNLYAGDAGLIVALNTHHDEHLKRRLLTNGFRIGKRVEVLRRAFAKGPLHVRVGTTEIMLRRQEASYIDVDIQA